MLKIGLTGSIGSGKTTIARIFESLGVYVYYADDEAKKFLKTDNVKKSIKAIFGESIFNNIGEIDKKALANIVFNDNESLEKLNNIIHPLVMNDFEKWTYSRKFEKYIVHEAAIIFEAELQKYFDEIITVSAPYKIRQARIIKRDKVKDADFVGRDNKQWDESLKISKADHVIYNDEEKLLIPQVLKIHQKIISKF